MTRMAPPDLHVVRTGARSGVPVLLMHPVGLDLTYWGPQIEALRGSHEVIAYDLTGHGRSEIEPDMPLDMGFERHARDAAALLDRLAVASAHVVGISFGGMVAQHLALACPGRIASLSLIATASEFAEAARAGMRDRARRLREGGMPAVVEETMARWFTPETRAGRPDLVERATRTLLGDDPAVHAACWEAVAALDTTARLAAIACPALVLVGEADPSCPPAAARLMHQAIPGARLAVLPATSHMAILESPALVSAHLSTFLAQVGAAGR